jgi:hypothetical protein
MRLLRRSAPRDDTFIIAFVLVNDYRNKNLKLAPFFGNAFHSIQSGLDFAFTMGG